MEMTKFLRPFILSVIIMLVLASCGFFGSSTPTETPLPIIQQNPSISQLATIELIVQADTSVPFTTVGQVIKYNFNVKNVGAAPAPGPAIVTGATCPEINTVGNLDASLDLNETVVCTSTYTITQADLDKGSVTNIATATVNGINSIPVTTTVATAQPKVLTLTATANPLTYNQVGQIITFTYVIKNSGAGNLGPTQFTVNGGLLGTTPLNCGDANTSLTPGLTVTCTSPYTITQNDLTTNTITNQVTASGGGAGPSQAASATINKSDVVQSSAPKTHTVVEGEWLWQIARCYGVDPNKLAADNKITIPIPSQIMPGTILTVNNPGSYSKYYGPEHCVDVVTYTVQTGDTWNSLAQKYSADPTVLQLANPNTNLTLVGNVIKLRIPNHSTGIVTIPPTQEKALTLTVTANPLTYDGVGQVITFTYVIKNSGTGNLGPAQFTVNGGLLGATPLNCGDAAASLAPNAAVTCTAPYTITQNDLATDTLTNQVTASGGGAGPSLAASATINKGTKVLTLTITANPLTYNQAGQVIAFTYVIKNSGTGNLGPAQFTVSGGLLGATPINCGDAAASLTPGATLTCTISYTILATDLNTNTLTHQATASGGGAGPSQPASVTITKQ
jgi:LysM repeat protein